MPSGIYIAYTGAVAAQSELDVIANNVANVGTSGYRRDHAVFDTVLAAAMPYARIQPGQIDFSPGTHQPTNSPLHAAIDGDGFFVVQDAQGNEFYTRRGDFRLNAAGELVLPNGLPVQGQGGPLAVPPGARAELRADGTLTTQNGPIGRLRIVRFADPAGLSKHGRSLIAASPEAGQEEVDNPRIAVGFVEASNVNLSQEMVGLIIATRAFESIMQSLRANDQLTQQLIQTINR
ncbi:MAG: flagellar hook basal-body protein [Myxococcales bacterium]|nr:flagellar hook basal-body protein [Myxococcales bacterium]